MNFLEFLSHFRTDILDYIFRIISFCGEITVLLPLICIIYWCINKSTAYKALFAFFLSGSLVQGAKIVFRIPRPWILNPQFSPVDSAMETATGYSFPSGHVQSSSSIFLSLAAWSKKKAVRILCCIIVLLVLFSRMYLGVHTPLDVFTSLLISIVMIFLLKHVTDNYTIPQNNKTALLILAIAYALGLIFYSLLLVRWNISTMELTADSIVFACSLSGFAIGSYVEDRFIRFGTECLSIFMQFIKIFLGLGGLLLITKGFSLLPLSEVLADSLSGFFACIWATCIFPLFIRLVQKKKYSEL